MGFTQSDWLELQRLQANLGRIRFGPRSYRPPPIQLGFLPKRPKPEPRKNRGDDPGYERYQLRLW